VCRLTGFADPRTCVQLERSGTSRQKVPAISEPATHPRPHDHVVQFYDSAAHLFDEVGGHLSEALAGGAVAIALASADHARGFETQLAASGVDLDAAVADGSYQVMDAAETLQRILIDGRPDARLFDDVVGGLVRAAAAAGRPVCAYGEMVALLWEDGHVNAAIALEALWNDLGLRVPFSLFCSYPSSAVTADQAELLSQVCCSHTAVVGAAPQRRSTQRFDASPEAPRASRRFLLEMLRSLECKEELVDDAALVVTELATNAVLHARSGFTVTVASAGGAVRVEVSDESRTPPRRPAPSLRAPGGRGLALIEAVASSWGVLHTGDGKIVWAQLASVPAAAPRTRAG
jgi:anti-sigma regulatory factor (Ser/Thr protein kinase)